jgi:iron(III) transport system substrate-binding protein
MPRMVTLFGMKALRSLSLAGALATILAARPGAAELPAAIQDAARKEGEVVIYGGIPGQAMKPIRELLENRYGLRMNNWRGDSEEVLNRIASEAKSGNASFDVVVGSDAVMTSLDRRGIFDTFSPPAARNFPKQLLQTERRMTPWRVLAFGINYNSQRLTAEQAPKRWEDLLDPKWKRKFLMANPATHSTTLQFVLSLEKILGPKWLEVVQGWAKQRPRLTRDPAEAVPTLTSGEVPLAIGYIKDKYQFGGPIDFVKMDRYLVAVTYVAVSKRAPHPNAARLFTDFFLGPEPQQIIGNLGDDVLNPEVEDRFRGEVTDDQLVPMRVPSPTERDAWAKKLHAMFK